MSKANASAKNRRAYGGNPPPAPQPQTQNQTQQQDSQSSGFTLQQVIAVIDKRLINLETFMSESKEKPNTTSSPVPAHSSSTLSPVPEIDNSIAEILEEFNNRFDMIVEEVSSLKDIVLKLQSYTMEVNKTLLEERIHILSDLGSSGNQSEETQLFDLIQNNNTPMTETIVNETENITITNNDIVEP